MNHIVNFYMIKQRTNSFQKKLILQFFEHASPKLTLELLLRTHVMSPESPLGCAICQDSLPENQLAVGFPGCRHPFHSECLAPHLENNSTCPNCRGDLVGGFMQEVASWQPAEEPNLQHQEHIETVPDRPTRLLRSPAQIRRMPLVELLVRQNEPLSAVRPPRS